MLRVKVRFTGKVEDINKIIDFMENYMDEEYQYKVLTLDSVSGFYSNRGSSDEGRVYCDFLYDPDIYHPEEDEDDEI